MGYARACMGMDGAFMSLESFHSCFHEYTHCTCPCVYICTFFYSYIHIMAGVAMCIKGTCFYSLIVTFDDI